MAATTLFAQPFAELHDANGAAIVGAKIYVYITGTATPQPVYHDATLMTAWTQPIVTNADGQSTGTIYVTQTPSLKVNITDSANVDLPGYPIDPWTPYALGA